MRAIPRLLAVCAALTACAPGTLRAIQERVIQEPVAAQVRGYVIDKTTNAPLAGAEVMDVATMNRATTDARGHFALSDVLVGVRTIVVSCDGFAAIVLQVELDAGQTLTVPAHLLALEPELSGFHDRKARGRGVFVDRDDMERWNVQTVTEVLQRVSGVRLQPRRERRATAGVYTLSMTHAPPDCSPIAFLDGAYLGKVHDFSLDATISPWTVEAIEIYRGPSEVPPRFDMLGAQCGVLAFWTR